MRVKITTDDGRPNLHGGEIISEDRADVVDLSPLVMDWSFASELWYRINAKCGTELDEYEGDWLESTILPDIARIIRGELVEHADLPAEYVTFLTDAPDMLERCASRQVRVMISL